MMYKIRLRGCDDDTEFFMDLTNQEYELVKKISEISKRTSTYDCMPTLEITQEGK